MADEIPTLKAQDAVELLAEWNLNITVEEINKPTTQTVQAIYDELIWQLLHIRLDDLDGPRNIIMQDMDNTVSSWHVRRPYLSHLDSRNYMAKG